MSAITKGRVAAAAAVIYLCIAIVTFGHAANANWQECLADRASRKPGYCGQDTAGLGAIVSAAGWPLYWSWQAQS